MQFFKRCYVNTTADIDCLKITHDVKYAIRDSKSPEGLLTIVVPESGAGLVVMPDIPEAQDELKATFAVFGGEGGAAKDKLKRDTDIAPVVQSAVMGRVLNLPFQDSKVLTGHYDEIFLVDFVKKPARREFIIQIISEAPADQQKAPAKGAPRKK